MREEQTVTCSINLKYTLSKYTGWICLILESRICCKTSVDRIFLMLTTGSFHSGLQAAHASVT